MYKFWFGHEKNLAAKFQKESRFFWNLAANFLEEKIKNRLGNRREKSYYIVFIFLKISWKNIERMSSDLSIVVQAKNQK